MKAFDKNWGEENDRVEFKTSFIFSNDLKNPDKDQKFNVFRGICSFMNTEGGTLYIGVKDNGFAQGVMNDIKALGNPCITNCDAYSRYIYDQASKYFTNPEDAKSLFDVNPLSEHKIIEIKVRKSTDNIIYMKKEKGKVAFCRTGTRTQVMDSEKIAKRIETINIQKAENKRKNMFGQKISLLEQAMKCKKKVRLINYHSGNSDTTRDRTVEPINFISNNESIWCYEALASGQKLKQFKLSRMAGVEILKENWEHEKEHIPGSTDSFRWSGIETFHVSMQMNTTARNILIDEFPEVNNDEELIDCGNGVWMLETNVHSLEPICRFCICWADMVQVYSENLKKSIRNYVANNLKHYFLEPSLI